MGDVIFLFFMFMMLLSGLARGAPRQAWSLAVLAVSTYLSGNVYSAFVNVTRPFVQNEVGSRFTSFVLVFIIVSALLNAPIDALVTRGRRRANDVAPGNRLAGGVLGVIEAIGVAEVSAALILTYPVLNWDGWVRSSGLIKNVLIQWPIMLSLLPSEFQHVIEVFR